MGAAGVRVDTLDAFADAGDTAPSTRGVAVIVPATTRTDRYQDLMSDLNSDDVSAIARDD